MGNVQLNSISVMHVLHIMYYMMSFTGKNAIVLLGLFSEKVFFSILVKELCR